MRYLIRNHEGAQIIQGSFDECEEMRRHYLDVSMMQKYRLLSRIYDNRAGAIAFRTALDRRGEVKCAESAQNLRRDLVQVQKRIAYYRAARPVEVAMRAA